MNPAWLPRPGRVLSAVVAARAAIDFLVLGVVGDRVHAQTGRMRLSAGLTIVALAMALLGVFVGLRAVERAGKGRPGR